MRPGGLPASTSALSLARFAWARVSPGGNGSREPLRRYAMHQQPRATEQPLALKIVSRSDQRSGVRGATVSFMSLTDLATSSRKLAYGLPIGQARNRYH